MNKSLRSHPLSYRTVWISDVHLGFRGCSADHLLDFLHSVDCEFLYLVGDIIDVWEMKRRMYWPQSHNNVLRTILGKAKHGTIVVYVPGNHDEILRDYHDMTFGNVHIMEETIHTNVDGRRFLITHGDKFDSVVRSSRAIAMLGTRLYDWLLKANYLVHWARRKTNLPYWSLAAFLKHKVKNAVQFISNFEAVVAYEAARLGVDGVVCGHIHRPEIAKLNEVIYCNCGDWVESCSALVEHHDGSLELLRWEDTVASLKRSRVPDRERMTLVPDEDLVVASSKRSVA
ncbi:MAG: UDP-2,3-diacylglucosamine diphosphatase [Nitrospira sp.]|nr:UDP-2,3-diacylglucosamine diphosphatase [Nitrospira sp.]